MLAVGDMVDDFSLKLINNLEFSLFTALNKGPVVINFIMGTWCPFCSNHLKRIREWQDKIKNPVTLIIISSEPAEKLREFVNKNPMTYLMASDPDVEVIEMYGVKKALLKLSTPATFLVDVDHSIKLAFNGVRTDKTRNAILDKINES